MQMKIHCNVCIQMEPDTVSKFGLGWIFQFVSKFYLKKTGLGYLEHMDGSVDVIATYSRLWEKGWFFVTFSM